MADFDTLLNEIQSPTIKRQLQDEADRRKAAAIIDRLDEELADTIAIKKHLPSLLDTVKRLDAFTQRPVQLNATLHAPAQPKPDQKMVRPVTLTAVAISAEIKRRMDYTEPSKFFEHVLPGDNHRIARKAAAQLYKSATDSADSTNPTFAAALVSNLQGDLFRDLAPSSVLAKLVSDGYSRRLNFRGAASVTFPRRERDTLSAAFVGEKNTIPVKKGAFTSATVSQYKLAVIAAASNELRRVSNPEIVDLIEKAIIEDTATALDGFFLDNLPNVGGVRPAGILNGANTQASAGTTVENVLTDLRWLLGELIAMRARKPVILINPLLVASLSLKTTTGTGVSPFAADLEKGKLGGLPFLAADTVPAGTVIGLDADSLYSGIDSPLVDLSDDATLVLIDDDGVAPTMAETGAITEAGSVHVSDGSGQVMGLFQSDSVAIRFVQPVSWIFARPGVVSALTGVAW